jgi:competence protein ComEC
VKPPWRHSLLAGLAVGLGAAPLLGADPERAAGMAVLVAGGGALLALTRPRTAAGRIAWTACVALIAAAAGIALGAARTEAIDAGALRGPPGARVSLEGRLASPPRSGPDGVTAKLDTAAGAVELGAPALDGLGVGSELRIGGRLAEPPPWLEGSLARRGIAMVLEADSVEPTGERRGGVAGTIDAIRGRAERALDRGLPDREAALARGFVLGQDDRIDGATREDFRRAGLTHLLAVSGQNVILLCLLAWPLLALLGLTLRARLLALLALIAIYVPLTGAGPSIQRAGVMGAAGLVAALADRPGSRWYALLLAAVLTLALNPRAAGDVGWQLSFAAVVGIFLWSGRLAALLDRGAGRGSPRRALAEGAALTIAATVATAPLMAHQFGSLSIAALPANVLALPAVAPAMWLGMLSGIAGQLPALPIEPLNWVNSLCLAYIGQIARWLGSPQWALLDAGLDGLAPVATAYAGLTAFAEVGLAMAERRRGMAVRDRGRPGRQARRRVAIAIGAAALVIVFALHGWRPGPSAGAGDDQFSVRVLDVGQGDSILLDPPGGPPILVDAGPPGAGVAGRLRELGVSRLGAVVITHDQSDHAGGAAEVLETVPVERLVIAAPAPRLEAVAAGHGVEPLRLAEGGQVRSGALRLTALWPPRELLGMPGAETNQLSLVLLAEWRHLSVLLTGDAEARDVPLDPGPVDLLKVAHHGSEDEGLEALLDKAAPKLALLSVGENSYGHPAPETLAALAEQGVPVARTDERGELAIDAGAAGWTLAG